MRIRIWIPNAEIYVMLFSQVVSKFSSLSRSVTKKVDEQIALIGMLQSESSSFLYMY